MLHKLFQAYHDELVIFWSETRAWYEGAKHGPKHKGSKTGVVGIKRFTSFSQTTTQLQALQCLCVYWMLDFTELRNPDSK